MLSPQEIAGVYPDAPLHMNPKTFDITAELVLPVEDLCQEEIPPSVNLTNRLVLVWNCKTEFIFYLITFRGSLFNRHVCKENTQT